jgi:hypothetical protein
MREKREINKKRKEDGKKENNKYVTLQRSLFNRSSEI